MRLRQRGGSPIGGKRLVRVGAAPLARLGMLSLYGEEVGDKGSVPVIGMPLRRTGNGAKRNERAALGRRSIVRLDTGAGGRVRLPQRLCANFVKPHRNTVSIQDNALLSRFHVAKAVPRAVNRACARKTPTFSHCLTKWP